jgi:hypothetical protein
MALQVSDTIITGTFDNLVFYKMDGKGYVRMKSSLNRKQFKTQRRFANSRKSASCFGKGNILASDVHNIIPAPERKHSMFIQLRSAAIAFLKAGAPKNEVNTKPAVLISSLYSSSCFS